jgi:hypothetical protein
LPEPHVVPRSRTYSPERGGAERASPWRRSSLRFAPGVTATDDVLVVDTSAVIAVLAST